MMPRGLGFGLYRHGLGSGGGGVRMRSDSHVAWGFAVWPTPVARLGDDAPVSELQTVRDTVASWRGYFHVAWAFPEQRTAFASQGGDAAANDPLAVRDTVASERGDFHPRVVARAQAVAWGFPAQSVEHAPSRKRIGRRLPRQTWIACVAGIQRAGVVAPAAGFGLHARSGLEPSWLPSCARLGHSRGASVSSHVNWWLTWARPRSITRRWGVVSGRPQFIEQSGNDRSQSG
jgi:hypothetical protein